LNDSDQRHIKEEDQNIRQNNPGKTEDRSGLSDPVIWHFVLKHLDDGTPTGRLKANITIADVAKNYFVRGVYHEDDKDMHFYIGTDQDGRLNSAIANIKEQADPEKAKLILAKIHKNVKADENAEKKHDDGDLPSVNSESKASSVTGSLDRKDKSGDEKSAGASSFPSRAAIILISLIFLFAVVFNVFVVEFEKYKINRFMQQQAETTARLNERLDNIKKELAKKNKETSDLIDFHNNFVPVWKEYQNSIKMIVSDNDSKPASLSDVAALTDKRTEISRKYLNAFKALQIPDIMQNFYESNIAFIESDIGFWELAFNYYNTNDQSQFDYARIEEIGNESKMLFEKAREELTGIYDTHDLSYFLKEYE
jgi:uncharacterized membrane-anchored protein YhcB (DUF1043 family)